MDIIAHRGASFDAPENTLSSVRLAWEQDADGIEIDLQITQDRKVVLLHDEDVSRTTQSDGLIKFLRWSEICLMDAGSWKDESYRGEQIPLLETIWPTIPDGKKVYLDIKPSTDIVTLLKPLLQSSKLDHECLYFVGEDLSTMQSLKTAFQGCRVLLNVDLHKHFGPTFTQKQTSGLFKRVNESKLDGLGLKYCDALNPSLMNVLNALELLLFVWTVDDKRIAQKMQDIGAHSLATNRPEYLKNI